MWQEVGESSKSSRLAMAGSIYMRKKSLENTSESIYVGREPAKTSRTRNPSSGKIIKNVKRAVAVENTFEGVHRTYSK